MVRLPFTRGFLANGIDGNSALCGMRLQLLAILAISPTWPIRAKKLPVLTHLLWATNPLASTPHLGHILPKSVRHRAVICS